jgi:type I restriction enzyme R subunit
MTSSKSTAWPRVEMNPVSKQSDLVRALEPVADRLVRQFKAASDRWKAARLAGEDAAADDAHTEMESIRLSNAPCCTAAFSDALEL